jgi:hypothetical protein
MNNLLDFENREKGYKHLYPSKQNFKDNIGKIFAMLIESMNIEEHIL